MLTAIIFVATYAVVAIGRVPGFRLTRTGAALVGAALMIVTGAIAPRDALASIDWRTIGLLLAMMALVAPLQLAGVFPRVVVWVGRRVHHPATLLASVVAASGLLSALFVNDTICVAFTPLVLDLAAARRHDPVPFLLALATASNIGSTATIVGNPQNMLIGSVSGIGIWRFTAALAPIAVAGLALDVAILWLLFRRELTPRPTDEAVLDKRAADRTHGSFTAANFARAIDWRLLALFVGLFVVVGAAERAGIDKRLFAALAPLGVRTTAGLSATAAALSNLVSNVPAVMLFTPVVRQLPDPSRAWLALAMSSTLAGNLTILGSIANLIVVESARRRGVTVSARAYARAGVPITLATIAFGVWWLS
jgi:Na+/H+ antiporter NhaD/arsenite permease-like protein